MWENREICSTEREEWLPIKGYENIYYISNMGRVKSKSRMIPFGRGVRRTKEKILKQYLNRNGYPFLILSNNHHDKTIETHRLVAVHFIANDMLKKTVNHIDGNPKNNKSENLEWTTMSENNTHKYRVLKLDHPQQKRVAMCDDSFNILREFKSVSEARKLLGVNIGNVAAFCRGVINHKVHGHKWKYV